MSSDGTHPDIPDKGWTNPFPEGHPLHDLFERRIKNKQDLVILVDDYHARRGTGKTVASLQMAQGMNQHGWLTDEHVSLMPEEIRNAYESLPKRSALVLDESEIGASKYDASTKTNKALREIMSIGRVEEKYVILNTPDVGQIDSDIRKLADVWMTMLTKGVGLVHWIKRQPYARGGSGKILNQKEEIIHFKDIQKDTPLREVYNGLTAEKKKHIAGEKDNGFIPIDEHREVVEKEKEQTRIDTRNEIISDIYDGLSGFEDEDYTRMRRANGVSQSMIGDAVGLTQQQIGNITRND